MQGEQRQLTLILAERRSDDDSNAFLKSPLGDFGGGLGDRKNFQNACSCSSLLLHRWRVRRPYLIDTGVPTLR